MSIILKSVFAILLMVQGALSYTKSLSYEVVSDRNLYFQISEITIKEVTNTHNDVDDYYLRIEDNKGLQSAVMIVDGLIAIGKKVWPIIENNKPVVDVDNSLLISVLPNISNVAKQDIPFLLTNWSVPKKKSYRVSYKNGFGSEVISFTYSIYYQYGGKHNDKGQYLTGINVLVDKVDVSWGFKFSAKSSLIAITNHGSKVSPIAGASFKISYIAKSVLKEIRSEDGFHIQGNGILSKL